ncbi:uncharacterized protein LOC113473339, partial [Diaphorina citri]
YIKNKINACKKTGIYSICEKYDSNISESELIHNIHILNKNPLIHGILVQLPLPKHINAIKIIESISSNKDVDGYSIINSGKLMSDLPGFRPCTSYGCIKMIKSTGININGKHAVIIGRSNIVGKPMALLLLKYNATVTVCHSKTKNIKNYTKQADIIITAVGKPNIITGNMIKIGSIIIDVGINRDINNKIRGDVDFSSVLPIAGFISPVPGGVGPMTIAMLLINTVESAEKS